MTVAVTPSVFRSMLNGNFDILRQSYVSDGQGGSTQELEVVRTVRGRLRPALPQGVRERVSSARLEVNFTHVLYLESGDAPAAGEYFRISDDSARLWRVVEVAEPSYAGQHVAVHCTLELDPENEEVASS